MKPTPRLDYIVDLARCPELPEDSPAMAEAYRETSRRIDRLSGWRTKDLLLGLLIELERLDRSALAPDQRFEILQRLTPLVRRVIARTPRPQKARVGDPPGASTLTLEQRLFQVLVLNHQRLLRDLDRPRFLASDAGSRWRDWTQRRLIRYLGRQILYAAMTARAVPRHTWRDLHDLFVYLVRRANLSIRRSRDDPQAPRDAYFEVAYKRSLLAGLLDRLGSRPALDRSSLPDLGRWALESLLMDPAGLVGRDRLILVDVTRDQPPCLIAGSLDAPFPGWVLVPPEPFLRRLDPVRRFAS
ncbi:hypothetical protein ABC977_16150 [Thioalkalicoccus limnaeus]|uniref:DUF2357 domain-containing protein n=1 Tax=Thioalkalicoccus limnaeus TaxID=120681 RepID=A0ABV4BHC1_9GAMM